MEPLTRALSGALPGKTETTIPAWLTGAAIALHIGLDLTHNIPH